MRVQGVRMSVQVMSHPPGSRLSRITNSHPYDGLMTPEERPLGARPEDCPDSGATVKRPRMTSEPVCFNDGFSRPAHRGYV